MPEEIPDTNLVRGDPPALGRSPSQVVENMLELVKTPNEWGRIVARNERGPAGQMVSELRSGKRKKPPGRWEFMYAEMDDGRWGIWARYLGK